MMSRLIRTLCALVVLASSSVDAQDLVLEFNVAVGVGETDAALPWIEVPFEERDRRFAAEIRNPEWASAMERAIAEEIASWHRPAVELLTAECRETLCRIDTAWPRNVGLAETGQQLSYLYGLGIDHQGETLDLYESNRFRWVVIAQRR